jgi:hypothetical protein
MFWEGVPGRGPSVGECPLASGGQLGAGYSATSPVVVAYVATDVALNGAKPLSSSTSNVPLMTCLQYVLISKFFPVAIMDTVLLLTLLFPVAVLTRMETLVFVVILFGDWSMSSSCSCLSDVIYLFIYFINFFVCFTAKV